MHVMYVWGEEKSERLSAGLGQTWAVRDPWLNEYHRQWGAVESAS